MQLVERDQYLSLLRDIFHKVCDGEGHSVFISGEAGIGKTSLVKNFSKEIRKRAEVYEGVCDSLFTPRPLAPLYDISWQISPGLMHDAIDMNDRAGLFSKFFQQLKTKQSACVIIFEDIHWADEATLDFIKFMARRINQVPCMFILTYRENEVMHYSSLTNVMGHLAADTFTRMKVSELSREAVASLSTEKGYDGEKVYALTGGNPFYVTEILASYSEGIPPTIRDGILSAYNRTNEQTKHVWELLSIIPGRFETKYLRIFDPAFLDAIENCLKLEILIHEHDQIYFKHELFRKTIENSLSPLKRIELNKKVLDLFLHTFEDNAAVERIVHHAKNANEYNVVVQYAPIAAKQAAAVGAHTEAARLLSTAIEYYQGRDEDTLSTLYGLYAYECYLTSEIREAIIYTNKILKYIRATANKEQVAYHTRFLSQLWWLDGNRQLAFKLAQEAIDILEDQPSSPVKAMTYSNMAHLKMLCNEGTESTQWSNRAIIIAEEINDQETLCHALNNLGSVRINQPGMFEHGCDLLQRSIQIALSNGFEEHAARAYSNLAASAMKLKKYDLADATLQEGIKYAEERELDLWVYTLLTIRAKLYQETGRWNEALAVVEEIMSVDYQGSFYMYAIIIKAMIASRTGAFDIGPVVKVKQQAFEKGDTQLLIPTIIAVLELEWLTSKQLLNATEVEAVLQLFADPMYYTEKNELRFWLRKARHIHVPFDKEDTGFDIDNKAKLKTSAGYWKLAGNNYMQALVLCEGSDDDKKAALVILNNLGATTVGEKLKQEMRSLGVKGIPRGIRKSTSANLAKLTSREMEILLLLKEGLQNKEIANKLFISAKTVDHHISSILFKLDVNSRVKAVSEAVRMNIIK